MPAKWFVCPDGFAIEKEECIKQCRMNMPCLSLPSRVGIAQERPFKPVVSPSAAGKGVRQIYLEGTCEYAINPRTKMFMLYGTKHHALKEEAGGMLNAFLEEKLEDELGEGFSDYMDGFLFDFKLVGAYAVAKRSFFEEVPTGEEYQKAGVRTDINGEKVGYSKGDPKVKKSHIGWNIMWDDDWALQLNRYRMMWEAKGFAVGGITIEATLRDGGVRASSSYGLDEQVYMIPIPIIPDDVVMKHYREKQELLVACYKDMVVPPMCTWEERWEGRKCDNYCDVRKQCEEAGGWDK